MIDTSPLSARIYALVFCVLGMCFPLAVSSHPLKLSASLIEYDGVKKSIRMECKVFIDDFELSLMNSVLKRKKPSEVKKADRPGVIEAYFQQFYRLKHNGKQLSWKFKSLTPLHRENVLVIQFADISLKLQKGDRLVIENTMFFRDFGYAQTNRIAVRIPAFKVKDAHAASVRNHVLSYVLGESKK